MGHSTPHLRGKMKTGFKETNPSPKDKKIKSPWNFDVPPYDERSSCYVNAGTHYGVGINQPIGHKGNPSLKSSVLPNDRRNVHSMKDDDVPRKNLKVEIDE